MLPLALVCLHPGPGILFSIHSDSDPDPGADQGFSWCPDGLTERVIDRLYGALLHDSDQPTEASDGATAGRLLALPTRRPVVVSAGQGGEAA